MESYLEIYFKDNCFQATNSIKSGKKVYLDYSNVLCIKTKKIFYFENWLLRGSMGKQTWLFYEIHCDKLF